MPTKAEQAVGKSNTKITMASGKQASLSAIVDAVQQAADQTQAPAWRFEDFDDGSRIQITCFPKPRTEGELAPRPSFNRAGHLHKTDDGRLFRCVGSGATPDAEHEWEQIGELPTEPQITALEQKVKL